MEMYVIYNHNQQLSHYLRAHAVFVAANRGCAVFVSSYISYII